VSFAVQELTRYWEPHNAATVLLGRFLHPRGPVTVPIVPLVFFLHSALSRAQPVKAVNTRRNLALPHVWIVKAISIHQIEPRHKELHPAHSVQYAI
jgi:hypothetical protein